VLHVHAVTDVDAVELVLVFDGQLEHVKYLSALYVPIAHASHAPIAPISLYYLLDMSQGNYLNEMQACMCVDHRWKVS
jgi:hypothetical protein